MHKLHKEVFGPKCDQRVRAAYRGFRLRPPSINPVREHFTQTALLCTPLL